jgi:glutamine synthetase
MISKAESRAHDVLKELRESNHQKVKVAVTDTDGVLRGKYLNKDKFLNILETGFGFCNAQARIDFNTFRKIPWENQVPFFLGDFEEESGKPLSICPRQVLKKVLNRAESQGLHVLCGMEFEWFNFKETPHSLAEKNYSSPETLSPQLFDYSILRSSLNQPFLDALMDELRLFDVPLDGFHSKTGPGILESSILYSDALEAADRAVLFKTATKQIACRFGIMPSFMAKWNSQLPGCGGHIHQSIWNASIDKNLFFDENDPLKMSPIFKHYLAGQMKCLPEILPLFAPTVNSYKRLIDGYWAPTQITWGIDDKTTAFRVIPENSRSTRLEARVPGADVNPYLAIAGCIASGLYGIENRIELEDHPMLRQTFQSNNAEPLPRNLYEAAQKMSQSDLACEIMGKDFVEHFVKTRIWEWKQFQDSVTNWELQRYFEII